MQFLKGISFLLIISFIVSCTTSSQVASNKNIQKRKYRSGLFVQNQKKTKTNIKRQKLNEKSLKRLVVEKQNISDTQPLLIASTEPIYYTIPDTNLSHKTSSPKAKEDTIPKNTYDILMMENGDEIKCKVLEISSSEIKYKKIELLDGPTYTSSTSKVFMIQFANGTRELIRKDNASFTSEPSKKSQTSTQVSPETKSQDSRPNYMDEPNEEPQKLSAVFGVLSLISGILGFFVAGLLLGPGAIIFGIAGAKKKRKGRGMAITGIILGIVDIIGALIVINMYM